MACDLHRVGLEVARFGARSEPSGEEPFAVLAEEDEVDGLALGNLQRGMNRMEQLDRTHALVKVELLPQVDLGGHLNAVRPADGRQAHGAKQNGVVGLDCFERRLRKRVAAVQVLAGADGV